MIVQVVTWAAKTNIGISLSGNLDFCLEKSWKNHGFFSELFVGTYGTLCNSTVYSKKTSKLHVTGLCEGNSPVTGEFPTQRASNAENASIWWHHHDAYSIPMCDYSTCSESSLLKLYICMLHYIYTHFSLKITIAFSSIGKQNQPF